MGCVPYQVPLNVNSSSRTASVPKLGTYQSIAPQKTSKEVQETLDGMRNHSLARN